LEQSRRHHGDLKETDSWQVNAPEQEIIPALFMSFFGTAGKSSRHPRPLLQCPMKSG
jgi:hypothetical protein